MIVRKVTLFAIDENSNINKAAANMARKIITKQYSIVILNY